MQYSGRVLPNRILKDVMMEDTWGSDLRAHDFCVFDFSIYSCSFVEENLMLYSGTGDGRTHTHTHTQTEEIEDIFTLGDGKVGGQIDTWNSIIVLWSTYYKSAGLNSASEKLNYVLHTTPQWFCSLWCNITYMVIYRVAYL
jgi:hypothetical protein